MNGIFEKVRIMLMQNSQENINYQKHAVWKKPIMLARYFEFKKTFPKTELIFVTTVGNRIFSLGP